MNLLGDTPTNDERSELGRSLMDTFAHHTGSEPAPNGYHGTQISELIAILLHYAATKDGPTFVLARALARYDAQFCAENIDHAMSGQGDFIDAAGHMIASLMKQAREDCGALADKKALAQGLLYLAELDAADYDAAD